MTMEEKFQEEKPVSAVSKKDALQLEKQLIESAQNGDKAAFGKLIRLHQKKLFRYVYGLVKSFDQTEDIVQDAFVKAWQALETFKTGYAFYPWLATIARNHTYNQITRQEKQESLDQKQAAGYDPATVELGPLEQLIEGQAQKRFYQAVMALPVKYRSVFVLRHFEDMDYARIASYLNIPPGTVDSRLYRARQMLMEALKDLL